MSIERLLHSMLRTKKKHMHLDGKCCSCGAKVEATVSTTESGLGLSGAVLFEHRKKLIMQCGKCFLWGTDDERKTPNGKRKSG